MQYKNFIITFICLIVAAFTSVDARICKTNKGIAWCEDGDCYWKSGSGTFSLNNCGSFFFKEGVATFHGSNCRKCANKKCGIVQSKYTGRLNYYHHHNGYLLTANGWCYNG